MKTPVKKRLTLPLISVLVLISLGVGGFIFFQYLTTQPITVKEVHIDTKAALKLNVLKQISKKNGITEWELNANSATLLKDRNKAVLDKVSVIFYTKENKKIHLKSQKGMLNTKTHDLEFSQDVVITYEDAVLRTETLQYNKKEHIIHSNTQVTFEKGHSVISADSMTTRLNDNLTVLDGHVKGKFSENFKFQ